MLFENDIVFDFLETEQLHAKWCQHYRRVNSRYRLVNHFANTLVLFDTILQFVLFIFENRFGCTAQINDTLLIFFRALINPAVTRHSIVITTVSLLLLLFFLYYYSQLSVLFFFLLLFLFRFKIFTRLDVCMTKQPTKTLYRICSKNNKTK